MKKKSKQYIYLVSILAVLVVLGLYFGGFLQSSIGLMTTKDTCLNNVKGYCSEGYQCTSCSQVSLSGSTYWTADCEYGSSTASGRTACASSGVVSHAKYQCGIGGDVYWYNSESVSEGVKEDCSYGCVNTDLKTASCKSAPRSIIGSSTCLSLYDRNCPTGCYVNSNSQFDSCVDGSNGIIRSIIGMSQCKSLYNINCPTGCYNNGFANGVSVGICADGTTGLPPECDSSFVQKCSSETSYVWCNEQKGKIESFTCLPNWKCVEGAGVGILRNGGDNCVAPINTIDAVIDRGSFDCSGIDCSDYCSASGSSYSGGSCNSNNGGCVYSKIVTMSSDCLHDMGTTTIDTTNIIQPICKVYSMKDGSSCGTDKIWKIGSDKSGCAVFDCVNTNNNIPMIIGIILGSVMLIIIIVLFVRKK